MSQLVAKDLYKSFKNRHAVRGISFEVKSGSVVGLLGPNGAGKTTSFYMMLGLITPDKGRVELDNKDITDQPIYRRSNQGIGYLPQEPSIFRNLNVSQNIEMALDIRNITGSRRREIFERLINDFGLASIANSYGYALSGGERRRVEIARSLVGKPKFLLLDEPFAGIDPIAVHDIQEIIKSLRDQSIGILITDHNVRETLGICDFGYIMKDGTVQVKGSPQMIADSSLARKFYLGENFQL